MTAKSKTRKAPATKAAAIDPIFAAIAAHKALTKKSNHLWNECTTARALAEKKYGEWLKAPDDWPGEPIVTPLYDRANRADLAARIAGKRLARMKLSTLAGAAALADYTQRSYTDKSHEDWAKIAFKAIAAALKRMAA
jgi:hypothetical protein